MAFREINEPRNYDSRREQPSSNPPSPSAPSKPSGELKRSISTMRIKISSIFQDGKNQAGQNGR